MGKCGRKMGLLAAAKVAVVVAAVAAVAAMGTTIPTPFDMVIKTV